MCNFSGIVNLDILFYFVGLLCLWLFPTVVMLILKLSFAETEAYLIYVPIDVEEKVQKETEQDGQKEKLREEENTLERATTEHKRVGNKIHEETQQPKKSDEDICVEGAVSNLQEHDRKCYGTAMEEQQEMQHYQNGTKVYLNISKYILHNTDVGVLFFGKKKKELCILVNIKSQIV